MHTDDSDRADLKRPNNSGNNGAAAGHQRRAPEPGSPGGNEVAPHLAAGHRLAVAQIIAFSNIADYLIHPETSEVEVGPGVSPAALLAVESVSVHSETSTVEHEGETITTTTTTTSIVLRDKLAALESLAGEIGAAGPGPSPSRPTDKS
jgi:hypothetical protein